MPLHLTPLQIFENYIKANPQKCKGKSITEICILAGLNDKQIAELKNTSAWLCFNKENTSTNQDFSMTELLGGNFSQKTITKVRPKTNFNRKIEPTFQSTKQGDCWLLSDINALNQTEWGKQAICDAIIPDEDDRGGVTIKFKGSPLKQKEFYFTAEDIDRARNSGRYASGDDDMIALELATENLAKLLVDSGKYKRCEHFDYKDPSQPSYISGGGVYDRDGNQMDISTYLTGRKDVKLYCGENSNVTKLFIKNLVENKDNIACVCTFMNAYISNRDENLPVHGGHAYAIKKFVLNKFVILIDPYHADEEIKLSWKDFVTDVELLTVATKNTTIRENLEGLIPNEIKKTMLELNKQSAKIMDDARQRKIDLNIMNNIFPQVAKILINFNMSVDDIKLNKINELIETDFLKNTDFELYYSVQSREIPFDKRIPTTKDVNKDNVLLLLEIKPDLIKFLDKYKSGWGNGKEKKKLIEPIINALVEKAKDTKINGQTIENFKNKCNKELDAIFYTDEKVIQSEVENMVNLIKSKS